MSVDNKPNAVTDPQPTPELSSEQVIQNRMAEGRESLKGISNLVPDNTQGGTTDVTTQGGSSINDSTTVDTLKVIEASTGRKFASVEDFNKHYMSLNSLVGDNEVARGRKALETLEKWEKQYGKPTPELEKLLADTAIAIQTPEQTKPQPVVETKPQPTEPKSSKDETEQRIEKLEHEYQLTALEKKYPNATNVAEEISLIAKSKGISYIQAFEGSPLKQLVELKAKEESQKSPMLTPSNRINVDYKNLENLGLKMATGRASQSEQIQFAKEFFKTRGVDI